MEFLSNLFKALTNIFKYDIAPIATMPIEIWSSIFRQLDPQSLLNAARVSKDWMDVCRNDVVLKCTAQRFLRRQKIDLFKVATLNAHRNVKCPNQRTKYDQNMFYQRKTVFYHYHSSGLRQSKKAPMPIQNGINTFLTVKRMLHRFRWNYINTLGLILLPQHTLHIGLFCCCFVFGFSLLLYININEKKYYNNFFSLSLSIMCSLITLQ